VLISFLNPSHTAPQELPRTGAPTVIGPVTAKATAGGSSRDYVFFSAHLDLQNSGYVEEEFFFEGLASRYATPTLQTATVIDGGHPYTSRMVVRRPIDAPRFNGVVVVEWLNVTAGVDIDIDWLQAHPHLIRAGYAWIGVSAQRIGIHGPRGLKAWNQARYDSLDVTADGAIVDDALAYDIFSHVADAVSRPGAVQVLGPLEPQLLIATGHSQSANKLATYYNSIHPRTAAFDGYLIHGGGDQLRTDLTAKAWKLVSETDRDRPRRLWQCAGRNPLGPTRGTYRHE
jgi:hypothetical protein